MVAPLNPKSRPNCASKVWYYLLLALATYELQKSIEKVDEIAKFFSNNIKFVNIWINVNNDRSLCG